MLARLKVDREQQQFISSFIDAYLKLTAKELKQYISERSRLPGEEQEAVVEIEASWSREGRKLGRIEGREEGLLRGRQAMADVASRVLSLRLGVSQPLALEQIQKLTLEQLAGLVEDSLKFGSVSDFEDWLSAHQSDDAN